MSTADRVAETAEAVCAALYANDFEMLGEQGATTYFRRGTKPKMVAVEVLRSSLAPMVLVTTKFLTTAAGRLQVGQVVGQVPVVENKASTADAAYQAVYRVLEIFRDVLEDKGVTIPKPEQPGAPAEPMNTRDF